MNKSKLSVQVLLSCMHQTDHSILDKVNIQSAAIVVNQCDRDEIERFEYKGHQILWMSLRERGIGLSRNTALMRATADIVLFADDDVQYKEGYVELIVNSFEKKPSADFIAFCVPNQRNGDEKTTKYRKPLTDWKRLHWYNSLHYGTYTFAVRRAVLKTKNIGFHLAFGGGATFSSGEDSIFITDALKKGLHVWASPIEIGQVHHQQSTWFKGYTEQYWFDKGVLLKQMFGWKAFLLAPIFVFRNRHQTHLISFGQALYQFMLGVKRPLC